MENGGKVRATYSSLAILRDNQIAKLSYCKKNKNKILLRAKRIVGVNRINNYII